MNTNNSNSIRGGSNNRQNNSNTIKNKSDNNIFINKQNSDNTIINNNITKKYDNRTIQKIIYSIPEPDLDSDDTGVVYRDVLSCIVAQTREHLHIFKGFVNDITEKRLVLYNVFWNNNVYACSHINIFDFVASKSINVGDYIVFLGEIYSYRRKKTNTEDMAISMLKLKDITSFDLSTLHFKKEKYKCDVDYDFINKLSREDLYLFYNIQINKMRDAVEYSRLFSVEIYESILLSVYYEDTKEYDMFKERLHVINEENVEGSLCKWACFIRFLMCENKIISPFIIYTLLAVSCKRTLRTELNHLYNGRVRKFAMSNVKRFNIDKNEMMNKFNICFAKYIEEFKNNYNH